MMMIIMTMIPCCFVRDGWHCFMCGLYYDFNNLRFNNSLNFTDCPMSMSSVVFVSSGFLKLRLLKRSPPY